jgi:hypothetical protein
MGNNKVGQLIEGKRYQNGKYLYDLDKWDKYIRLATDAQSIIGLSEPDLANPCNKLYYVSHIPNKAFYDHSKFYAGADYHSTTFSYMKYMDHEIFLVQELNDDEIYVLASGKLALLAVIGKLAKDCVLADFFIKSKLKFVP